METVPTTAIAEYSPIEAVLADLTKRHKGVVFDVTQPGGMKDAKAAAKDIAQYRIALEKKRTDLKAGVLERGRLIDGEAKRISVQLAALEDPITDQIKAEERREEDKRQAAIKAEEERLAAIERERKEAEARELAEARAKIEAENKRLADERAKLEAEQKAARDRAEAEDRARRAKIDEEERAAKQRIADAEEKARKKRLAEEDRLRAESRKLDEAQRTEREREAAEARAKEAAERKVREQKEAAEREQQLKLDELLDAGAMLDTFVERFGHLRQFASVTKAIKALPAAKPAKKAA